MADRSRLCRPLEAELLHADACNRTSPPRALLVLPHSRSVGAAMPPIRHVPPVIVIQPVQPSSIAQSLNNRWLVIGLLLCLGPLGLPALWFSPRFGRVVKVGTTVAYLLLTVVVPVATIFYFLELSLRPLVNAW